MILGITSSTLLDSLLFVFGGLGIFLYGINIMGDSLKDLAGNKLQMIIEKSTNTPLKGILVGAMLTAVLQSSSGTTALTVGLVRSGLMTLPQAIGIIMGANIGTTVTSFIIGLKIQEYSLIFVGIGAILIFFFNRRSIRDLGKVILGFGMLFFGLQLMESGLGYVIETYEEQVTQLFSYFSKIPVLGLLVGSLITAVVQSSSATIGILQTLYNTGKISLLGALPILIGCNIGTTITAVFASIGGNTEAKRTAVVHAMFNIIGALLFMILLRWAYVPLMEVIDSGMSGLLGSHSAMTIAIAHMIFNFTTTAILFWFIKQMVWVANKVVKAKESPTHVLEEELLTELLDYKLIKESPALAITFIGKCINFMGDRVVDYYNLASSYALREDPNSLELADKYEESLDLFDKRIHDYLIFLTLEKLHDDEVMTVSKYLDVIKDFERIGDHCSNIMEFFNERYQRKLELSLDSIQDLEQMFNTVKIMVLNSTKAIKDFDLEAARIVEEVEPKVDTLETVLHERHNHRIEDGTCTYSNSDYYVELLSNLERVGDHCKNVADKVISKTA